MKQIITEEMRFRQKLCDYALKNGVTKAARKYHTYRKFVYRQLAKYDGTVHSLALKSRRPHHSPNRHSYIEIEKIKQYYRRHGSYGLAEVYIRLRKKGYTRSFGSMCRQIKNQRLKKIQYNRKSYVKFQKPIVERPGDMVQVDIKYIPNECIRFVTYGKQYYQITAIDCFTRKRVLAVVDEKSTYHTSEFLKTLEAKLGFNIKVIQVDNGYEFVNDIEKTDKISAFEKVANKLDMIIKRTRPYSPWQNGKVERSHRIDGEALYKTTLFYSLKELKVKVKKHERKYNSSAKVVLGFKSPNQVLTEHFENHKNI